jgi:hypothetical protein
LNERDSVVPVVLVVGFVPDVTVTVVVSFEHVALVPLVSVVE